MEEELEIKKDEATAFLALSTLRGIGYWSLYRMALKGESFFDIIESNSLEEFVGKTGLKPKDNSVSESGWETVVRNLWIRGSKERKNLENSGVRLITRSDKDFPEKLKKIKNPPFWIFCQGNVDLLNRVGIAIVGSRKVTEDGVFLTQFATYSLTSMGTNNVVTISGLAAGVDQVVHQCSIDCAIPTIAVLGTGILMNYPAGSEILRDKIINSGGLVISEYLPNARYSAEFFIRRNRLQAGLARVVIPAYWREKSGTSHTVNFAYENNTQILCLETPSKKETFFANKLAKTKYDALVFNIPSEGNAFIGAIQSLVKGGGGKIMVQGDFGF